MAAEQEATLLTAAGSAAESARPFGLVRQLFQDTGQSVRESSGAACRFDEDTITAMLAEPGRNIPEHLAARVNHSAHTLLLELAARHPVVIAIDDAHHMDEQSLQCLLYIARRLRTARVAMVFTLSSMTQDAHPLIVADLLRLPNCHTIRLQPLSEHGVGQLLDRLMGDATHNLPATAWAQISGCNPLLVRALIDDYCAAAHDDAEPVVGDAFAQAVLSCLHRGTPEALHVARGIAILGEDCTLALLTQLTGITGGLIVQIIRMLDATGLTQRGRFRYPQVTQAIVGDLNRRNGVELHQKAAELLHRNGGSPAQIAKHLLAADPVRQPWAVQELHEAARRALDDNEVDFAGECLQLATWAATDEQDRVVTRGMLLELAWRTNPQLAEPHLKRQVQAMRHGRVDIHHLQGLLRYLLWHGRVGEAAETLAELKRLLTGHSAHADSEVEPTRLWLTAMFPPLADGFDKRAEPDSGDDAESSQRVAAIACPRLQATRAVATALTRGADDSVVTNATHVLRTTKLGGTTVEAVESALLALVYADRLIQAAYWCDRSLRQLATEHSPGWYCRFAAIRAEIAFRQGDLLTAEQQADFALVWLSQHGRGVAVGGPLACLLLARCAMGKHKDAVTLLDQPTPDAMFHSRYGLLYRYARGSLRLATNQVDSAIDDFLLCGELMRDWSIDVPTLVPWRSSTAEAYLRMGRVDEARELVAGQAAQTRPAWPRAHGITLRALAATSAVEQRPPILTEAVELLRAAGAQLELAKALADLGTAYGALGKPRQARMLTRSARHIASTCGAMTSVAADWDPSPKPVSDGKLTEAEGRIASMAAQGYTNKVIADRLFITASTVEQHLTRVYRKLNVKREELPFALGLLQAPDDESWEP